MMEFDRSKQVAPDENVVYNDTLLNLFGEACSAIAVGEPVFALRKMELRSGPAWLVVEAAFEHVSSMTVLDPVMPALVYESTSGACQYRRKEGRLDTDMPGEVRIR